jgi:hypothetical protein
LVKTYYLGAALSVVVALFVTVFILQSPRNAVEQVSKPIDLFIGSMANGGANLDLPNGELPPSGEPTGMPPAGGQPTGGPPPGSPPTGGPPPPQP